MRHLAALLLPVGLLIAAYAPIFAVVSLLRPALAWVPLCIILGSLGPAIALMHVLKARARIDWTSFGFRGCEARFLLVALLLGIVIGAILQAGVARFPSHLPVDFSNLPVAVSMLYFAVMAPVQEETIFRGLMQTASARPLASADRLSRDWLPIVVCALLFGAVHSEVNLATVIAACVLGLLCGWLRCRSGSLMPALVLHALCNGWAIAWPFLFR